MAARPKKMGLGDVFFGRNRSRDVTNDPLASVLPSIRAVFHSYLLKAVNFSPVFLNIYRTLKAATMIGAA
jgi:hypothetical protein